MEPLKDENIEIQTKLYKRNSFSIQRVNLAFLVEAWLQLEFLNFLFAIACLDKVHEVEVFVGQIFTLQLEAAPLYGVDELNDKNLF